MTEPRRRGLGRGLDALLGGEPDASAPPVPAPALTDLEVRDLRPSDIEVNPEQPRRNFDEEQLEHLAESLRTHGVLQPVVVEPTESGRYRLVAGERRWRAAQLAGLSVLPAVVRPPSESARHALELALAENVARAQLSPLEEARAFSRLADTFGLSHEAIGQRVGRSRPTVSNAIRLLALSAEVQHLLEEGAITVGHARCLVTVTDSRRQLELAEAARDGRLSVRQLEARVSGPQDRNSPPRPPREPSPADAALARGLEAALGTPVAVERAAGGAGRLVIEFFSDDDLTDLYTRLGGADL